MRVLIVDDHPDTTALQAILRAAKHEVRIAHRGEQAIELARDFVPEVALVELQLPDISGFAVAKRLRLQSGRRVNLVAISGGDLSPVRFTGSFDQYASKPVGPTELYQLIDAAREMFDS